MYACIVDRNIEVPLPPEWRGFPDCHPDNVVTGIIVASVIGGLIVVSAITAIVLVWMYQRHERFKADVPKRKDLVRQIKDLTKASEKKDKRVADLENLIGSTDLWSAIIHGPAPSG